MAVRRPRYSKEEFARRGDQIYDQDIRSQVEAEHHGEYVAIDIETGQWEMDPDEIVAGDRLLKPYSRRSDVDDSRRVRVYSPLRRCVRAEASVILGTVAANQGPVVPVLLCDADGHEHATVARVSSCNRWRRRRPRADRATVKAQ
jgi:hypothetical protein